MTNINGQILFFVKSATNYVGLVNFYFIVSNNSQLGFYVQFFPPSQWPPYDQQKYTFVFGDTPIVAQATNFTAQVLMPFTNQLLATFTNSMPGSDVTNFSAVINWGDNSTNGGVILTNLIGQNEVRGTHTYTTACGTYPVYTTIKSYLGTTSTVVSSASVPPSVSFKYDRVE